MKKIVRLTENDLVRLTKKIINETKEENLDISDVKRNFSFTYEDLKTAFEEGGENMDYDDMRGFEKKVSFEKWFNDWFKKNYL
jgi:hypothetical protein